LIKLDNEELYNLYSLQHIMEIRSRRIKWAGYLAQTRKRRATPRAAAGKLERKTTTLKNKHR
jgi:hypothetical protein